MHDHAFVLNYLHHLAELLPRLDAARIAEAVGWLRQTRETGSTIYICGNGGSASIASQMVVDVMKGAAGRQGPRYRMLSLADSLPTLSAYANDLGYSTVFVEPLKNFARSGDVLIALSCSGESENVLRAVQYARTVPCRTIGLTAAHAGRLRHEVDLPLLIPTTHAGRLEDCFFLLTHALAYALMEDHPVRA